MFYGNFSSFHAFLEEPDFAMMPSISSSQEASGAILNTRHFTRHKTRQKGFYCTNYSAIGILLYKLLGNRHLYQVTCTNFLADTIKLELNFVAGHERKQHKHTTNTRAQ